MLLLAGLAVCAEAIELERLTDEPWPTWSSTHVQAIKNSQRHFVCGGLGVLYRGYGQVPDGVHIYFNEVTREPVSMCGGACMIVSRKAQKRMCGELCPPPEWTADCEAAFRSHEMAKRPDIDEKKARWEAYTNAGCVPRKQNSMDCELKVTDSADGWWIEVVYIGGQDSWTRSVFGKRSGVRFHIGRKGQTIQTIPLP